MVKAPTRTGSACRHPLLQNLLRKLMHDGRGSGIVGARVHSPPGRIRGRACSILAMGAIGPVLTIAAIPHFTFYNPL